MSGPDAHVSDGGGFMEPWTPEEQRLLSAVPAALAAGTDLLKWWRRTHAAGYPGATTFPEAYVFNRPEDTSFGFFDTAPLATGPLAVNGNVQRMFYDEPKAPRIEGVDAARWIDQQIREFVLHYFLRISDFRRPQPFPEAHPPAPPGFGFLRQCPDPTPQQGGFGFRQLYYRAMNGAVGRFRKFRQDAIVDLRRLGLPGDSATGEYEWIVLRNPIFNFSFEMKPFGNRGPKLVLPLSELNYLVTSRDFVVDEIEPEPGILGRYGVGYAFVRDPEPSPLAYGPGRLEPAFELLVWTVHETGEVTVEATFVADQPSALLALSVDPMVWGLQLGSLLVPDAGIFAPLKRFYHSLPWSGLRFDPVFPSIRLLNGITLGQAAERLCISEEQVMKGLLFVHFMQHYQTLLASLQTWRQVPDWLDRDALPDFVVDGRSS